MRRSAWRPGAREQRLRGLRRWCDRGAACGVLGGRGRCRAFPAEQQGERQQASPRCGRPAPPERGRPPLCHLPTLEGIHAVTRTGDQRDARQERQCNAGASFAAGSREVAGREGEQQVSHAGDGGGRASLADTCGGRRRTRVAVENRHALRGHWRRGVAQSRCDAARDHSPPGDRSGTGRSGDSRPVSRVAADGEQGVCFPWAHGPNVHDSQRLL